MTNNVRLLTLIACLSAANVGLRIVMSGGPPNVKPTAFLVIFAGVVGGPIAGFAVGWLSMMVSDLVWLGAGVWTIGTSAGMAIVGFAAALLWHRKSSLNGWRMALGGFLLVLMFDVGTSIGFAFLYSYPWWTAVLNLFPFISGGVSPYPFGLAHELTTAVLLGVMGPSLITRVRKIYQ